MLKTLIIITTGFCIIWCGACNRPSSEKDSLTAGVLHISKEAELKLFGRNPDISVYNKKIICLAEELAARLPKYGDAHNLINKMNDFIFNDSGLTALPDSNTVEYFSLYRVLDNKKGSCLGLTGLYLVLAEKLDLPLRGVLLPGHVFVRYKKGSQKRNIETLKMGIERTDDFYQDYFKVPAGHPYYLRELSKNEVLALFRFNLGNAYRQRGLLEDAAKNYNKAIKLFPDLKEARENLAKITIK